MAVSHLLSACLFWCGLQRGRPESDQIPVTIAARAGLPIPAFAEIHSIQLLDEEVRSRSEAMFWSGEFSFVLRNGKSINLIDHGNQREIPWDAGHLSRMIDVPVWDFFRYRQPADALDPDEIKASILQHIF